MPFASTPNARRDAADSAAALDDFLTACASGLCERAAAAQAGVPRSTLRDARERRSALDAEPAVVAFFTSPAGQHLLHRLVLAAHVALTLVGPCGVAIVGLFLRLAGLSPFVACSYGAQ